MKGDRKFWRGPAGRSIILLLAVAAGLTVALLYTGHLITSGMCGTRIATEVPSPSSRLKAVVYELDCGATTDFSTQVAVLKAGEEPEDSAANAFIADSNHAAIPVSSIGVIDVHVQWLSNVELKIQYPERARVFKHQNRVRGVSVLYEAE